MRLRRRPRGPAPYCRLASRRGLDRCWEPELQLLAVEAQQAGLIYANAAPQLLAGEEATPADDALDCDSDDEPIGAKAARQQQQEQPQQLEPVDLAMQICDGEGARGAGGKAGGKAEKKGGAGTKRKAAAGTAKAPKKGKTAPGRVGGC